MPQLVLTNTRVTINSVDLTDHVTSVTLDLSADEVETTAFGDNARKRIGGLQDNSVTIDFQQDYAVSNVEATIYPLLGSTTTVVVLPNGTAAATANPRYTFTALVTEWQPVNGAVGDLATASVTWPISGTVTKAFT
jgi:hypothetical protein